MAALVGYVHGAEVGGQTYSPFASAQLRLLMEQIDQLSSSGQFQEAFQVLAKLFDDADGLVVEYGPPQKAATQVVQRLIPIRQWVRNRTLEMFAEHPAAGQFYRDWNDESAISANSDARQRNELAEANRVAQRFAATSIGSQAYLRVADLCLERGWSVAAKQAIQNALPEGNPWQVSARTLHDAGRTISEPSKVDQSTAKGNSIATADPTDRDANQPKSASRFDELCWPVLWQQLSPENRRKLVRNWLDELSQHRASGRTEAEFARDLAACVTRLVQSAALENSLGDLIATIDWAETIAEDLGGDSAKEIRANNQQSRRWYDERILGVFSTNPTIKSFAGAQDRNGRFTGKVEINAWPTWRQRVDRITGALDRNLAGKPRVGEAELGALPYHPIVHNGKVFVNHMRAIFALDLKTGKYWPTPSPALPLYDSGVNTEAFVPLG